MDTRKHVCPLCDYVYEDAKGEPSRGIPPGTPFENLPADWSHPACSARKDIFEICTCASLSPETAAASGQNHTHRKR